MKNTSKGSKRQTFFSTSFLFLRKFWVFFLHTHTKSTWHLSCFIMRSCTGTISHQLTSRFNHVCFLPKLSSSFFFPIFFLCFLFINIYIFILAQLVFSVTSVGLYRAYTTTMRNEDSEHTYAWLRVVSYIYIFHLAETKNKGGKCKWKVESG